MQSKTGVHQGCPLGPVGFALGIRGIIKDLGTQFQLIWNSWYLDDSLLIGEPSRVGAALAHLQAHFATVGLSVNLAKCALWGPGSQQVPFSAGVPIIPWAPNSGCTVLGVPIHYPGSTAHFEAFWAKTVSSLSETLDRVNALTDSQVGHHLIRACLDGCKVNHLLTATDP